MKALFLAVSGLFLFFHPVCPAQDPVQGSDLPTYAAKWAQAPITVDGILSDPAWVDAPWSREFVDIRGFEYPEPLLPTRVKVLWDETFLYIGADITEPDIWGTLVDHDAIIYRDDDFEVFLDPDGDGEDYFELEVNAMGTILDLFLSRPYGQGGRAELGWDASRLRSAIHLRGTLNDPTDRDQGWSVELAIPWTDLIPPGSSDREPLPPIRDVPIHWTPGTPPAPGSQWRVNFSRVDWPLEVVPDEGSGILTYRKQVQPDPRVRHPEENWVWSVQGKIDMHLPEMWGFLRFIGPCEGGPHR